MVDNLKTDIEKNQITNYIYMTTNLKFNLHLVMNTSPKLEPFAVTRSYEQILLGILYMYNIFLKMKMKIVID